MPYVSDEKAFYVMLYSTMPTRSTIKEGINLGQNNVPANYVDIVIPSTDTNNAINVANTFNGTPIFYVDATGNCSAAGYLTCSRIIQSSSNGIALPSTYSSGPGTDSNMLAYVNASINTVSPTFTSGTTFNVNNILLTPGVWFIMATINFEATTSNSSVLRLSLIISTSPTSNDANAVQNDVPIMNYPLGTSHMSINITVTRIVSHTTSTVYYANTIAVYSAGTLDMPTTRMVATRLA